jgi:hypothetical protein
MKQPLVIKESEFHTRGGVARVKATCTGDDFYPRVTDYAVPDHVRVVPDIILPAVVRVETPDGDRFSVRAHSPACAEGVLQGEYTDEAAAALDLARFAVPLAGDAVVLTGEYPGVGTGTYATIQGVVGQATVVCSVVFNPHAFRGTSPGALYEPGLAVRVSAGGGPVVDIAAAKLVYTGRTHLSHFWHWRDYPRADGGQTYTLEVPLWEWRGCKITPTNPAQ